MKHAKIISSGSYVPQQVITNVHLSDLVSNYDASLGKGDLDSWYTRHYGIKERRWAAEDELPSHMAVKAAQNAIEKADVDIEEIGFLILNTAFGDYQQPTTATLVQKELGMSNAFAIEINMPCAGPLYGIALSQNLLSSGKYNHGLVIGVDRMSGFIDKSDFVMAGLFGDGAGACLVTNSDEPGVLDYHLKSRGEAGDEQDYLLKVLAGKAKYPGYGNKEPDESFLLQMNKGGMAHFFAESFEDIVNNLFFVNDIQTVDWIIPHQASEALILQNIKQQRFDEDKVVLTLNEYGNTSSASLLITLDKYYKEYYKPHQTILLAGVGGGLNWGGVLFIT